MVAIKINREWCYQVCRWEYEQVSTRDTWHCLVLVQTICLYSTCSKLLSGDYELRGEKTKQPLSPYSSIFGLQFVCIALLL